MRISADTAALRCRQRHAADEEALLSSWRSDICADAAALIIDAP